MLVFADFSAKPAYSQSFFKLAPVLVMFAKCIFRKHVRAVMFDKPD
jgi:hypothetical protein